MTNREHEIYDVVGIGFGPSNLSLSIALEERARDEPERALSNHFFERQPRFGWHRDMLLPSATMQISFLKDLVTFRNPTSSFSFISFLHAAGRLSQFVNNQDFFPTRQEFHQYLEWAQSRVAGRVSYGSAVTSLRLAPVDPTARPDRLRLTVADVTGQVSRVVEARNVVISTGLVPKMLDGVTSDERVWHSSEFLQKFRRMDPRELRRVAVVGAGQSAAEITRFLYDELPHAQVSAIIPSYGYSIADATPFANQIFDPRAVDHYYFGSDQTREAFWRYHRNTNYAVVDDEVIRDLYRRAYDDEVRGVDRLHFLNLTRVDAVKRSGAETRVLLRGGPAARRTSSTWTPSSARPATTRWSPRGCSVRSTSTVCVTRLAGSGWNVTTASSPLRTCPAASTCRAAPSTPTASVPRCCRTSPYAAARSSTRSSPGVPDETTSAPCTPGPRAESVSRRVRLGDLERRRCDENPDEGPVDPSLPRRRGV